MNWDTFDRYANRAQVPLTFCGYLGWAYALWPKGAVLFGHPKDMNYTALMAVAILLIGLVSVASQTGLISQLTKGGKTGGRGVDGRLVESVPSPVIKEIVNQTFQGQEILLDGYVYIGCTFTDVTFVYNNGETGGFDPTCKVGGNFGFKSRDPHIQQMLFFLEHLRFMRPPVKGRYTPVLDDLHLSESSSLVIRTPAELAAYWSRLVSARNDSDERLRDFQNVYEHFLHFWEALEKQRKDPQQVRFDKIFPGDSLTPEEIEEFRKRALTAAIGYRESLTTVILLLGFQVPPLGVSGA